jgi:putative ABC transport system substrate-binding protein
MAGGEISRALVKTKIFVYALPALILITIHFAAAQQAGKVSRIGALHLGTTTVAKPFIEAFERGLKELGYIIGSNTRVEYRYAEGKAERYSQLAAELVALKPALIVVWGTDVADAAKRTSATILLFSRSLTAPTFWD